MYYVCLCVYVLTRHSSEVNSLLASCRTALFGANTLLCGFIHMKLQDVVLHHHWRRAATTGQELQQHDFNTGSEKSHRSVTLVQEKLTYDGVPVSVTQRFFRCEGGRELTFTTVHWHSHLHKHRFIITNSPKHYFLPVFQNIHSCFLTSPCFRVKLRCWLADIPACSSSPESEMGRTSNLTSRSRPRTNDSSADRGERDHVTGLNKSRAGHGEEDQPQQVPIVMCPPCPEK